MAITTQRIKIKYTGDGVAKNFPVPLPVYNEEHIHVYMPDAKGIAQEISSGFEVHLEENRTCTVRFYSPIAAGIKFTIARILPYEQNLDIENGGHFSADEIELTFDELEMQIQQLAEELGRAIKYPIDYEGYIPSAPEFIENMEKLSDKACACAARSCECAEVACECADRAEEAAANIDDSIVLKGGTSNLQDTWTTAAAIASGGTLKLPVGYFPTRNILRLTMDGITCYPKGPNVPAALPQYEEVGAVGAMSREVKLLFAAPAGAVWNAWVVASNIGELQEELIDRAEAAAEAADKSASDAKQSATDAGKAKQGAENAADRAEEAASRVENTVDLAQGDNLDGTWETTTAISSGDTLRLPVSYISGRNVLRLSTGGMDCYRKDTTTVKDIHQYEEIGAKDTVSRDVKILFDAPAGTIWNAWVVASNVSYRLEDFAGRAEASATKAETCKTDACACAADALESKTAANTAKTAAANSATAAGTAATKAEAAQAAAEGVKSSVDAAKTAAQTAAGKAETASTLAQAAQTEAVSSASVATDAKTAAESAIAIVSTAKGQAQTAEGNAKIAADKAAAAALAAQSAAGTVEALSIVSTTPITTSNTGGTFTFGINAASAATANYVIQRDASGRAKVAAPAAADDIARKAEIDAAIAKIPALSDSTATTSSTVAASATAVKAAYDKAVAAAPATITWSTTSPLTGGGSIGANRTLAISAATTAATGAVRLATAAEAQAGLLDTVAVTPLRSKARTVLFSAANTRSAAIAANTNYTVPAYVVGNNSLQVWLDGIPCVAGTTVAQHQYKEIGTAGAASTTIQFHDAIAITYSITAIV